MGSFLQTTQHWVGFVFSDHSPLTTDHWGAAPERSPLTTGMLRNHRIVREDSGHRRIFIPMPRAETQKVITARRTPVTMRSKRNEEAAPVVHPEILLRPDNQVGRQAPRALGGPQFRNQPHTDVLPRSTLQATERVHAENHAKSFGGRLSLGAAKIRTTARRAAEQRCFHARTRCFRCADAAVYRSRYWTNADRSCDRRSGACFSTAPSTSATGSRSRVVEVINT